MRGLSFAAFYCGLFAVVTVEDGKPYTHVTVVVKCEAGVVASMVVDPASEAGTDSGGTSRLSVLPTSTDLEGGGSGVGRGAVTTLGTTPGNAPSAGTDSGAHGGCTNGGSARTSNELLPSPCPSNTVVRGGTADNSRELPGRVGNGCFLGLPRLGLSVRWMEECEVACAV